VPAARRVVAVAIATCAEPGYLMQLRDFRPDIVSPGQWGLFGGSVAPGEAPLDAMRRELQEELGADPAQLAFAAAFEFGFAEVRHEVFRAHFACALADLRLQEGQEVGLFSLSEIGQGVLPSRRYGKDFPVTRASMAIYQAIFSKT
jgi:8-oxo-dGTP pyrophosphatase MutT (NUDIX family)